LADLIWQREDYIGENIDLIATLWRFEESEDFRYNLKYKIQATDYAQDGKTILRYDNANDAHGSRHHKHLEDDSLTEPIQDPFQDVDPENTEEVIKAIEKLWSKFKQEVKQKHED